MKKELPEKCPNVLKGLFCELCGGYFVCLAPWRKKRTVAQRKKARKEFKKK